MNYPPEPRPKVEVEWPHVVAHDYGGAVALRGHLLDGRGLPSAVHEGRGQAAFYRQIAGADEVFTDQVEPSYQAIDVPVLLVWVGIMPGSRSTVLIGCTS